MSDVPEVEKPEDWDDRVDKVLRGDELLNTFKDAADFWGLVDKAAEASPEAFAAAEAALTAGIIFSAVFALVAGLFSLLYADETEEKIAGARGFAYGLMWGVLGKGTPTATCGGPNELDPDNVKYEQQNWDAGANQGVSKASDASFKNRCLLWMAKNNDESGDQLLRNFAKETAKPFGLSDAQADDMFSGITVSSPVC